MKIERFFYIDLLRAISIIGVIAIHVLAFNLDSPFHFFIWNYLQFVVLAFVFCSGYVLSSDRYIERLSSTKNIFVWYKKRFVRLFIPFYIYLISHYALWLLLPQFFSGLGIQKNAGFIWQSLFLTGGVELNWLPLLFVELSLLLPFLLKVFRNKKLLFVYVFFSISITTLISLKLFPFPYRLTMWIPWSLVLLLSFYIYQAEKKDLNLSRSIKRYFVIGIATLLLFTLLSFDSFTHTKELVLRSHKYPPDFLYLSYATGMTFLVLLLSRLVNVKKKIFFTIVEFVSKNSYPLFFIHFIVFDMVLKARSSGGIALGAGSQFCTVLLLSLFVALLVQLAQKKYPPI